MENSNSFDKKLYIVNYIGLARLIRKLKKKKVITGGMIPKIEVCQKEIQKGVQTIHLTNTVEFSRRTNFARLPGTQIIK